MVKIPLTKVLANPFTKTLSQEILKSRLVEMVVKCVPKWNYKQLRVLGGIVLYIYVDIQIFVMNICFIY